MNFLSKGKAISVAAAAIVLTVFFIFGPQYYGKVDAVDQATYRSLKCSTKPSTWSKRITWKK